MKIFGVSLPKQQTVRNILIVMFGVWYIGQTSIGQMVRSQLQKIPKF